LTRAAGSLTTYWPWEESIAKILPLTLSACEPKPVPSMKVTSGFLVKAFATRMKGGVAAPDVVSFVGVFGPLPLVPPVCRATFYPLVSRDFMPPRKYSPPAMPKIERILIPISFSENSKHALAYGRFLADKLGATFDLLHVANPRDVRGQDDVARLFRGTPGSTLEVYNEQEIQATLNDWVREAGLNRTVRNDEIEEGDPAEVIIQLANDKKYDLIAMGHHRRASIGDFVSGGVVEKVMRQAGCPVVVCGGSYHPKP